MIALRQRHLMRRETGLVERFLVFNRGSAYACANPARSFLIPVNTQFHAKYGLRGLTKAGSFYILRG